jgi:uncharacterized protein YqhQ
MEKQKSKKIQIGGQAVIEGVMMRGPEKIATAVRRNDGTVEVQINKFTSRTKEHPIYKLIIIRGFVSLIEMLIIGMKSLNYSANRWELDFKEKNEETKIATQVEEILEATDNSDDEEKEEMVGFVEEKLEEEKKKKSSISEIFTIIFALLLAFLLFGYVPYLLASLIKLQKDNILFNLFAGSIRIIFFVLYVWIISLFNDVKRVFEYHGAEHKSVLAHENKEELTIENVKKYSTIHPRCGTSFMFFVLLVSILVFSIIDTLISIYFKQIDISNPLFRLLVHLPFLPFISGISYEFIKLSDKNQNNFLVKLFILPGMLLQKLTTQPPDDKQIETAIISLKAAIGEDLTPYKNVNIVN